MAIVPSGTRRSVVAQGMDQNSGFGISGDQFGSNDQLESNEKPPITEEQMGQGPDVASPSAETPKEDGNFIKVPQESQNAPSKSDEASDVSQYISQKLQSFGYPPRRLERFEEEFVHEKLFPGGSREMEIVIPDRYYGKKQRISDKDFASIVKEIQEKFGLTFTEADRKDKKIIMEFVSDNPSENKEEDVPGDVLDEVYTGSGSPSSESAKPKAKKNPTKKAETMGELLKLSKSQLVDKLINGEQK